MFLWKFRNYMKKLIFKLTSSLLVITFTVTQVQPSYALSAWLANDQAPMRGTKNDIAQNLEPGAIGNGRPLLELIKGNLPEKLEIKDTPYIPETIGKIRESLLIAIELHLRNRSKIPSSHISRANATLTNLIDFYNNLSKKLYLFESDTMSEENYLLGFNYEGTVGLEIHLVNLLYEISPGRLAQYIYHENIPEHYNDNDDPAKIDRESHRIAYKEIQTPIFGHQEVLDLGLNLRDYITGPDEEEIFESDDPRSSTAEDLENRYEYLKKGTLDTSLGVQEHQTPPEHEGLPYIITDTFIEYVSKVTSSPRIIKSLQLLQQGDPQAAQRLLDIEFQHERTFASDSMERVEIKNIMVILTLAGLYKNAKRVALILQGRNIHGRIPKGAYYLEIAETQEKMGQFEAAKQTLSEIDVPLYQTKVNHYLARIRTKEERISKTRYKSNLSNLTEQAIRSLLNRYPYISKEDVKHYLNLFPRDVFIKALEEHKCMRMMPFSLEVTLHKEDFTAAETRWAELTELEMDDFNRRTWFKKEVEQEWFQERINTIREKGEELKKLLHPVISKKIGSDNYSLAIYGTFLFREKPQCNDMDIIVINHDPNSSLQIFGSQEIEVPGLSKLFPWMARDYLDLNVVPIDTLKNSESETSMSMLATLSGSLFIVGKYPIKVYLDSSFSETYYPSYLRLAQVLMMWSRQSWNLVSDPKAFVFLKMKARAMEVARILRKVVKDTKIELNPVDLKSLMSDETFEPGEYETIDEYFLRISQKIGNFVDLIDGDIKRSVRALMDEITTEASENEVSVAHITPAFEQTCGISKYSMALHNALEQTDGITVDHVSIYEEESTQDPDSFTRKLRKAVETGTDVIHIHFADGLLRRDNSEGFIEFTEEHAEILSRAKTVIATVYELGPRMLSANRLPQNILQDSSHPQRTAMMEQLRTEIKRLLSVCDGLLVHSFEQKRYIAEDTEFRDIVSKKGTIIEVMNHGIPEPDEGYKDGYGSEYDELREETRKELGIKGDQAVMIQFGFVRSNKYGFDILEVLKKHNKLVWLLAGGPRQPSHTSYQEELMAKAKAVGVGDRVIITGSLEDNEISKMYSAADFAVIPYKTGSGSYVLSTSLGHGLPVVASALPFVYELRRRYGPVVYRALDDADFEKQVEYLTRNPEERDNLSNTTEEAQELDSWSQIAIRTKNLYEKALSNDATDNRAGAYISDEKSITGRSGSAQSEIKSIDKINAQLIKARQVRDFHAHSNCSDGLFSPEELVEYAEKEGVAQLSLTDHDTIAGLERAQKTSKRLGIDFLPGVELSSKFGEKTIHILGYGFDVEKALGDSSFMANMEMVKRAYEEWIWTTCEKSQKSPIVVTTPDGKKHEVFVTKEEVNEFPGTKPSAFHMGLVLSRKLKAISNELDIPPRHLFYIFFRRLEPDRALESYAPEILKQYTPLLEKYKIKNPPEGYWRTEGASTQLQTTKEAIRGIIRIGGIPVLAHPGEQKLTEEEIAQIVQMGIKGIELHSYKHTQENIEYYNMIAKKYGLFVTSGTDFHDPHHRAKVQLGKNRAGQVLSKGISLKDFKDMGAAVHYAETSQKSSEETEALTTKGPIAGRGNLSNNEIKTILKTAEIDLKNGDNTFSPINLHMRAENYKETLMKILRENPDKIFAFAIDSDLGKDQDSQIMEIYTAFDELDKMFPNLRLVRRSGSNAKRNLQTELQEMIDNEDLKPQNIFMVVTQNNLEAKRFEKLEGTSWITAIDNSTSVVNAEGSYMPIFEAATISMLASINADREAIKRVYDSMALDPETHKEITLETIEEMIKNRTVLIYPRIERIPLNDLKLLYERVRNVYIAA